MLKEKGLCTSSLVLQSKKVVKDVVRTVWAVVKSIAEHVGLKQTIRDVTNHSKQKMKHKPWEQTLHLGEHPEPQESCIDGMTTSSPGLSLSSLHRPQTQG